jgi:Flp pilus assembly protein TadB
VSKERALRRAEREAAEAVRRRKIDRAEARRSKFRRVRRKLTPRPGRTGRLRWHSRGQLAVIAVVTVLALLAIWLLAPTTALAVLLTILTVMALPVLVTIAWDRRSS